MSLFSSLNLARLTLGAHQTAIQTVGHNIANATTEGYARQRVQMTPTMANDLVFAQVGSGVRIARIERVVDQHLETNLRDARSDLANLTEQDWIWTLTESIFNDLDGAGLSVSLSRFFDAMQDLSLNPSDPTARSLLLEEGRTLSENFHFLDARIRDLREGLDDDIEGSVLDVNRLTGEIAALNRSIIEAEGGGAFPDTANDLRTRRDSVLRELADLVDIRVLENSTGGVQVLTSSEVLVNDGQSRELSLVNASDGDIGLRNIRFADNGSAFSPNGGRLAALLAGRDAVLPDLRGELDAIASELISQLNANHGTAEGLTRLSSSLGSVAISNRTASLDQVGLTFPIESGGFTIQVVTEPNGARESYRIDVDPSTMSAADLADQINLVVGIDHPEISAQVTTDGRLEIASSDSAVTFTFRDDDSGALTALGMNGMFTGFTARDIAISEHLFADPSLLSTGHGGGTGDNSAVIEMIGLRDAGLFAAGNSFEGHYQALIGEIGIHAQEARDLLGNQTAITQAVQNQRESLSGVNIDEEAISLLAYQRAYQGAARFLNVVDRLLETLINSI